MSRALNVLEEFAPPSFIDRAALMLDEGTVFNQWWKEDEGAEGGDVLPVGTLIKDQQGNIWERTGTTGLKLIEGSIQGAQFRTIASTIQRVGPFFMTQTGRAIELQPNGSFRRLAGDESGNLFPDPTGGSTYHPPAWKPGELDLRQQELQIERERLQADIAQTEQRLKEIAMQEEAADERQRLNLIAEREMLEMRLDNDKRTLLYSEYGATKRTQMQQQQSAREMKFQTREDPFAFAQAMSGGPMLGGTPAQAFRQNLSAFANAPIPGMSINTPIPEMEQILGQMGGMQMPMPGPYVGMAEGGIIDMEQRDGAFSMKPTQKRTVLVGDGGGIIPGVTEALTIEEGPFGIKSVEVTPLAGMAQGGMTVNPEAMKALLAPLFADISPGGYPTASYGQRASTLGRFGYQPSLAQVGDAFYLRSPEGQYREISPYYITGHGAGSTTPTPESAVLMRNIEELQRLGPIGRGLSTRELPDFLSAFQRPQSVGPFGPMSSLISEPVSGAMMPAPYQVAQELTRLRYENPTAFEGIMSAYANSYIGGQPTGFSRQAVLGQMGAATPSAGAFGGRRIGFTGGYL